jgi:hypothetical protein
MWETSHGLKLVIDIGKKELIFIGITFELPLCNNDGMRMNVGFCLVQRDIPPGA